MKNLQTKIGLCDSIIMQGLVRRFRP